MDHPELPARCAAEPKWDGYRAQLARYSGGQVLIRSRKGTDMTAAFPEIAAAAVALPPDTALDGELVVWAEDRLAFERLQGRLNRTAAATARLAARWPAHYVVFDLLRLGEDLTRQPYVRRRALLEELFVREGLQAPWALCPSTTDPVVARGWLEWASVGMEGLVFKPVRQPYLAGRRGWRKYRSRHSTEAVVGAVGGSLARPSTVLLGRYDADGQLQFAGRTTVLARDAARGLSAQLAGAAEGHPWTGWRFSAGWGTTEPLEVSLVEPLLVAEVAADVALDGAGRWRHPVRWMRMRPDLAPADVPAFGAANPPAAG